MKLVVYETLKREPKTIKPFQNNLEEVFVADKGNELKMITLKQKGELSESNFFPYFMKGNLILIGLNPYKDSTRTSQLLMVEGIKNYIEGKENLTLIPKKLKRELEELHFETGTVCEVLSEYTGLLDLKIDSRSENIIQDIQNVLRIL